ncbi:ThiF family adenylyltransferase [Kistimonas scapharcae]|uniref:ThiF family adenylyltransferase n=1 Tax=Kistimonas scapharcae TaxID=1036133 RepID=UPI0031EAD1D2
MKFSFDYSRAFSRNVGWFSPEEQELLKYKRVAIAGAGGVGGIHILTLARLGIGRFHLSDFDTFEIENMNRQVGANMSTLGCSKLQVMVDQLKSINPDVDIKVFPKGVNENNLDAFLEGVDCYLDALDFFALNIRRLLFKKCEDKGVPATTVAPLGMGAAVLNFLPGHMSFEDYFCFDGHSEQEQYLRFLVGLAPARLHTAYLVDPATVSLADKRGPSTIIGCEMAGALAASQVVKLLLNRGDTIAAPRGLQMDGYTNQLKLTWRPWGNRNPLQRLAIHFGRKALIDQKTPVKPFAEPETVAQNVIDHARWAPSGDNAQPWRFELNSDSVFTVHTSDTSDTVVYDLHGWSSLLAIGGLLETIEIAATLFSHQASIQQVRTERRRSPVFQVKLIPDDTCKVSPLAPYIKLRTVQRRSMGTRALNVHEKMTMERALPEDVDVIWLESQPQKNKVAKLLFANGKTRLTMKEAYPIHRAVIDWEKPVKSPDKIPIKAVGVDRLTAIVFKWTMASWRRVRFLNACLAGTWWTRIQLDWLPARNSAAHFALVARSNPDNQNDYLSAGRAIQRFWLTASTLNLGFQPQQTPVIFNQYLNQSIRFTDSKRVLHHARKVKYRFDHMFGDKAERVVFMGRLGRSQLPASRSIRKNWSELLVEPVTQ